MRTIQNSGLPYKPHAGQLKAFRSPSRTTAVIAGTQSGKTSFGPAWLLREIQYRGPGDYLVVTPTFPLLELKALPEFRALFEDRLGCGSYTTQPVKKFVGKLPGIGKFTVYFGHAQNPESLESATAKGAWMDEAGQKAFKKTSKEAIDRRVALNRGRKLLTTTPYAWNWLKTEIWDRRHTPGITCISFNSLMNPVFPVEEYEEAQDTMPNWRFQMFYNGIFTRPEGIIYSCFDKANLVEPFQIPADWPRYLGLDFGGANTAAVFIAQDPATGLLYVYREYHAGDKTAKKHKEDLLDEGGKIPLAVGGASSEDQWRNEFYAVGLPVQPPPIKEIEPGIDRVFGLVKTKRLRVFKNLEGLRKEFGAYSRELDEEDKPTEKIEDKEKYHRLDALRYIGSYLGGGFGGKLQARKGWVR